MHTNTKRKKTPALVRLLFSIREGTTCNAPGSTQLRCCRCAIAAPNELAATRPSKKHKRVPELICSVSLTSWALPRAYARAQATLRTVYLSSNR